MRILIINPNTSKEMSRAIDSTAKKYASPGTEITTVSPNDGPPHIANTYHADMQTPKMLDIIEKNRNNYDCFIIACASDPGVEAGRVIAKNVIGIGEAGILTTCAAAKRFSILYELKAGEPRIRQRLRHFGIDQTRLVSVKVIGSGNTEDEIVLKRHEMIDIYYQAGRQCIDEDGAGALFLSCAGMCDLKEILEERLKVPVFSGVESAVKIAEQLPA